MRYFAAVVLAFAFMTGTASSTPPNDKTPLDYPLKFWLFPLLMALLGGLASWYNKVKKGELAATNLFALMGEFVVSALAGLLAFLFCDWMNLPVGVTGAISGLAGHAGAKALSLAEGIMQKQIEQRFGSSLLILPKRMNGDSDKKE